MAITVRLLAGVCLTVLLSVAGVSAGDDLGLVKAVRDSDNAALRQLLARGNSTPAERDEALSWAARLDDLEAATLLIRAGADVNAANEYGATPLFLACTNGSERIVDALLKAGANPNTRFQSGETPLMTAARTGRIEAINALLRHGADVNVREGTPKGQTALMWAAAEGHTEAVQLLNSRGADVRARSESGFTPLMFTARGADLATAKVLLAAGADVNESATDGNTSLLIATMHGHTEFARFLVQEGADPNKGAGFTPLHWAAGEWDTMLTGTVGENNEWHHLGGLRGQGKLDFVKFLIAAGANPNARMTKDPPRAGKPGATLVGATPFLLAAKSGDLDVMRLLLDTGADWRVASAQNTTPLMAISGVGYVYGSHVTESIALEAVRFLLDLGADVNAANSAGYTALHAAVARGADTIVQLLVSRGANLNAKDKRGWTPLVIAEGVYEGGFFNRYPSTAALLLKLGAEPSPPDIQRGGGARRPPAPAAAKP